jgi:uncharacterized protein
MEVAGYFASLIIGISLGLVGGGGSILTVPVLVYLFRIQPVLATAYSLFIVGSTSLFGALPKYRQGLIHLKTALIFGIPSILAVFATRKFVLPNIPEEVIRIGSHVVTKGILTMILFAVLMVFAAVSMIRNKCRKPDAVNIPQSFNYPLILLEGVIVGTFTGLVGAGGGFLIIPALVLLSKLPMKQAVGTSLLIIAAKSLIGFTGDITTHEMDWPFLLLITAIATAGIFIGNWMSAKVHADKLKKGFGWFVLVMGIAILIREVVYTNSSR